MKYLILLLLAECALAVDLIGRTQSAAARGRLLCNGKPAEGVRVYLYDSDNSVLPGVIDTDDLMASGKTSSNGEYSLSGSTAEITDIEPYISIYHDCNDGETECQRTFRVWIPATFVSSGTEPNINL